MTFWSRHQQVQGEQFAIDFDSGLKTCAWTITIVGKLVLRNIVYIFVGLMGIALDF